MDTKYIEDAVRQLNAITADLLLRLQTVKAPEPFRLLKFDDKKGDSEKTDMTTSFSDGTFRPRRKQLEYRFIFDGKQCSVYGKTQKECYEKREAIIKGAKPKHQSATLGEWLEQWLGLYMTDRKQSYLDEIKRYITNEIMPTLGALTLSKIDGIILQEYLNGVSNANARVKIAGVLRQALTKAYKLGKIKRNPYDVVEVKRPRKTHYNPLEYAEQERFSAALEDDFYKSVFYVLCCTGLRVGEFCALDLDTDVDYINGTINVTKSRNKENNLIDLPKTETSCRAVPIVSALIRPHLDLISEALHGEPLKYKRLQTYFYRRYQSLKLDANIHSMRHTFISVCHNVGISAKQVQIMVGHSTIAMTMDVYTHVLRPGISEIKTYIETLKKQLEFY